MNLNSGLLIVPSSEIEMQQLQQQQSSTPIRYYSQPKLMSLLSPSSSLINSPLQDSNYFSQTQSSFEVSTSSYPTPPSKVSIKFSIESILSDATNNQNKENYETHGQVDISKKKSKSKRVRTIFTQEQLERLEEEFHKQQYMVGSERSILAMKLNLSEIQVKIWFQNRRIKWRKENVDSNNRQHVSNDYEDSL